MAFFVSVPDLQGRVVILDKSNKIISVLGHNPDPAKGGRYNVPQKQWIKGIFSGAHRSYWDKDGNLYVQDSNEDQVVANRDQQPSVSLTDFAAPDVEHWLANPEWPAFRGGDRSGRQHGSALSSDWSATPPEQLWKVRIGPGWSSFAVAGKVLFTQEQRGSMETTVCYSADSGNEVWKQQIESRFEDSPCVNRQCGDSVHRRS